MKRPNDVIRIYMTVITEDPEEYPIAKNPYQDLVYKDPKNGPITDEPNKDPIMEIKPSKVQRKSYLAKVTEKFASKAMLFLNK